jgi:predicted dehydrogenase
MSAAGAAPLRVGVIGCGEIAQLMHLPLLHELDEVTIAGLCDLSAQTLERLGERYGVALRTTDHAELLASPQIDAVVVCTYDHAPVVAVAIAAGKHVLVEKPLAFTAAEARPLVAAAQEAGVVALVGYMKLYDPAVERAIAQVAAMRGRRSIHVHDFAGRFDRHGELYTQVRGDDVPAELLAAGRADVAARIAAALGPERAGHGELYALLLMLGSHDLAVLRAVCGPTARVVHAQAHGDDHLLAVLEQADGLPCVLEIAVGTSYEWWDEWLSIHGADRELRIEFPNPYIRYAPTVLRLREGWDGSPSERVAPISHDSSFRRQWRHFAACVRGEERPRTPLADGLRDLELAEAVIAAMAPRPQVAA